MSGERIIWVTNSEGLSMKHVRANDTAAYKNVEIKDTVLGTYVYT